MSLRVRLLAAFAYVLVLVLVALEVPLALNVSRRVDAEVRAQAAGEAHLIAASASGALDDSVGLDALVARAARDVDGRVIVVDATGTLLADSAGPGLRSTSYEDRPEIAAVLADGRPTQGKRRSSTLGEDLLYTAVPVVTEGKRAGAVRVTQSVGAINAKVRRDILALAGIGAAALLLGLVLAWVLAGSLSRPLRALVRTAESVAGGDLDARAAVAGSTEQQELAGAFNHMTARLGKSLASQREFVANASHQLRTPLTGLRLRLEAATLKSTEPDVQQELEAAERETERLTRLLTGLLALAREGERPAMREPVLLAEAAERACERWEGTAGSAGHRLVAEGEDVRALASEEDTAIILDNLIENALLYSPAGGKVSIEWGSRDGAAYLAVLDEGPGLEPGEEVRVFERFARGTAGGSTPGTGLGLAIVQTLARRWGGDARLGSRPSGGARAEVTLPLAFGAEHDLPSPNPDLEKLLPRQA